VPGACDPTSALGPVVDAPGMVFAASGRGVVWIVVLGAAVHMVDLRQRPVLRRCGTPRFTEAVASAKITACAVGMVRCWRV
jgi:hypothetical protein